MATFKYSPRAILDFKTEDIQKYGQIMQKMQALHWCCSWLESESVPVAMSFERIGVRKADGSLKRGRNAKHPNSRRRKQKNEALSCHGF